ncbi:hypothetical protein VTJ49DRAFT_594 [Mycothermus thermophilus]|uniref:Septation initiation network scaffold protein cdc11 n=1 Tax=Humicola insolens TaxID=85995 RepID=A0ABR3VER0_HUMIN
MGHAWLDSLSEDWVSQPASPADASPAQATPSPDARIAPKPKTPSRIPRLSPHIRKFQNAAGSSNTSSNANSNTNSPSHNHVLGERSINLSRRTPSKLSNDITNSVKNANNYERDCQACRSASVASANSVIRNTVHRKSLTSSQAKGKGGAETPEWKRRLVYGDLSYGEQRDLFTSAGTGLESIFKPPHSTPGQCRNSTHEHSRLNMAMPSSPPPEREEAPAQETRPGPQLSRKKAPISYRRTDESADASKVTEDSHLTAMAQQTADGESRKVSGRSDVRNEDFSPIVLERRQASNGTTTFAPADLPADELHRRLETLRHDQMLLSADPGDGSVRIHSSRMGETTQDFAKLEGFVNFQRGSRSGGEGSFRNPMLSSALNDSSQLNPEESLQASTPKRFPSVRVERWDSSENAPVEASDPDANLEKRPIPPPHLAPSGSPLKLFQPYDTFTNQTLLRRLSQVHDEPGDNYFSIAADPDSPMQRNDNNPHRLLLPPSHANRFGAGELDGYEFNDSAITHDATGLEGNKENRDPDESALPPRSPIFNLAQNSSPSELPDLVINRRRKSTTSHPQRRHGRSSLPGHSEFLSPPGGRRDASGPEIKRPRTSPSKAPTPKRRRTLHQSDISYSEEPESPSPSRWNDFRGGRDTEGDYQEDSPPRSWTPSPDPRPSQYNRIPFTDMERSPLRSSRHSRPPTARPPTARPQTANSAADSSRKPSIKTEDFINEANKIMAMIRSKAGLQTGLTSVEESDEDKGQQSPDAEHSYEESTQEPFSRPPSREGRVPVARMPNKQEDPVLVERLKKYEEASEMGDLLTSMYSRPGTQGGVPPAPEQVQESPGGWTRDASPEYEDQEAHGVVSDPPNIRLSRNPEWQDSPADSRPDHAVPSQNRSTSAGTQSTGHSLPTGSSRQSSRGSEARKTIMPESVSHLIPDQVGDMVLDRQRNVWVKRKGSGQSRENNNNRSFSQSEMSEDDPFADIPDLSVDVTREMQNLVLAGKKDGAAGGGGLPSRLMLNVPDLSPSRPPRSGSFSRAGIGLEGARRSYLMRSQGRQEEEDGPEGRGKEPRRLTISFSSPVASIIHDAADVPSSDTHSDQTQELAAHTTAQRQPTRPRNDSRPTRYLSVRGKPMMTRPVSRIDERDEDPTPDLPPPQGQDQSQEDAAHGMELSLLNDYSVAPPASSSDGMRHASVSLLVTTPVRRASATCPAVGVDAAAILSEVVGNFSLSPLSEFTIHPRQREETPALEASYVVDNHRLVTGDASKRVMSMAVQELVDKLSEVEPFEPYWEDMRELRLRGKGLSALHKLDEYCGRLESLDASKNRIAGLDGVPGTVLNLKMAHNRLDSLTAWNHLIHLQYVDVSNNNLTSLSALRGLVHLRTLRADNNQITSLDGIKYHRGLQTLRARGNWIEELDFEGSALLSLTDLDLRANRIARVANLAQLPSLNSLNLEANNLTTFSSVDGGGQEMPSLRYLRLDDNKLESLNVAALTHLRLLHADRNCLSHIAGLSRARRIDSLSLREQRGEGRLDLERLLSRAYEVRKLYLSGNYLGGGGSAEKDNGGGGGGGFAPKVDLLNLQLLELANCGLSGLPEEFGLSVPNLRVLNLNMNALTDLGALKGVVRLKKLFVAGNRLREGPRVLEVLGGMRSLAVVDLRDNPLTQGFYASVQVGVVGRQVVLRKRGKGKGKGHRRTESAVSAVSEDNDAAAAAVTGVEQDEQQLQHHNNNNHHHADEDDEDDDSATSKDNDAAAAEQFTLPDQDPEHDARYCARLDMDTRVRRRLYETMVAKRCKRVRKLDGLPLDVEGLVPVPATIKPAGEKGEENDDGEEEEGGKSVQRRRRRSVEEEGEGEDVVWRAMKEKGLVKLLPAVDKVKKEKGGESSGRWPAEDSFA